MLYFDKESVKPIAPSISCPQIPFNKSDTHLLDPISLHLNKEKLISERKLFLREVSHV